MTSSRNSRPRLHFVLAAALVFQGLSGIAGGLALVADPTGELIGIPLVWLEGSPFRDYRIPGIVLLVVLGMVPLGIAWAVWTQRRGAWHGALVVAMALLIWIAVEIAVVGYQPQPPLQLLYGSLGLFLLFLLLLPSVRHSRS